MPGAKWYSQPDRPDKRVLGAFDPTAVADDEVRKALERIQQDLRFLQETCPNGMPVYGLRAHCWNPDLTRNVYGAHNAHFNTTVLSYPLNGNRNVWLPDAQARPGGYVEIVDASGTASATNITVKTLKGQKVNGASTYAISTNSAAVCFRSTGEGWVAIAVSSGGNASDPLSTAVTATNTFGTDGIPLVADGIGRGAKALTNAHTALEFLKDHRAVKTSSTDVLDTTYADTGLITPTLLSGKRYSFKAYLRYDITSSDADNGVKLRSVHSSSISELLTIVKINTTGTAGQDVLQAAGGGLSSGLNITTATSESGVIIIEGVLVPSADATFKLQHAMVSGTAGGGKGDTGARIASESYIEAKLLESV